MPHTPQDEDTLLERLRSQHLEGRPMRDRLYEIFEYNGRALSPTALEWEANAGMGNTTYYTVPDNIYSAAKELLRKGQLVRTFEEYLGWKTVRRIEHFDDLKFGLDNDNQIIIFDFIPTDTMPDPIIRPDKMHRSAVDRVKRMIEENRALVDQPLCLSQGDIIRPITTNSNIVEIRRRQMDFNPLI